MSALDHYRAPASGLVLVAPLVPLDPWRCRWFGHALIGRFRRPPYDHGEKELSKSGWVFYETASFPSGVHAPSKFTSVWCTQCGREWTREEQGK